MCDVQNFSLKPFELNGMPIEPNRIWQLSFLRVLDSLGWPVLDRNSPMDSDAAAIVPQNKIQVLNIGVVLPQFILVVIHRNGFKQVRWDPKYVITKVVCGVPPMTNVRCGESL